MTLTAPDDTPFSTLIRTASREQHTEAENSSFVGDLLGGGLGVGAYTHYTEQLWCIYRELEAHVERLAEDPVVGPFLHPGLPRLAALEQDLDHLHGGSGWRSALVPLPATAAYVERVREVAREWPGGYLAHHYTRYLGDLSGGQIIRGTAEKNWGFARKGDGVRFYTFDGIPNPAAFKREYRALLDAVPADALEKRRIVEECKHAFTLNTAVFRDLGREHPISA
ncbi:biliverdin-producing heme oxygenase [Streptomyces sp. HNM0574]|uniref:biliverdin-producing heme oxygenase n=1 Tax=Streptomyces sp. HNM0574 TaxID=2714954 RepID=UPI00146C9036|nr:biliverdin-producing heme oxygenase [Streptomyces sp. HNM0574]NLU70033.1 biliverdin-producing heme oxygenase [Streptomyces sp. HNM0574]